MISDSALKRICSSAVLNRARSVAFRGERVHARRCRYDGSETVLRAKIDASSSWDGPYHTLAVIDEEAQTLVEYGCDCPAAWRFSGPCKHAVALVIDFNERPGEYEGYDPHGHASSSRAIARLLERATVEAPPLPGASTEAGAATVRVETTLVFSYECGLEARFRLVGSQGSYVMKSITAFVDDVVAHAYHSYGKKLAFTHTLEAFVPQSRPLVEFMVRAIRNRRAYGAGRGVGRSSFGMPALPKRDLQLSSPEIWELLPLCIGSRVGFEDQTSSAAVSHTLQVVSADPDLYLGLVAADEGAYELLRAEGVRLIHSGGRAIAWDESKLYLCSARLSSEAALLYQALSDPGQRLIIAERDLSRFCATVLPRLERAVPVAVPHALDAYKPVPCELQFRLDRIDEALTCRPEAVYGERRFSLATPHQASDEDASLVRDVVAEARGREVSRRLFPVSDGAGLLFSYARDQQLAALVYEGVAELGRIGTVFATSAFERLRSTARPRVHVGVSVRSNLLDLSLEVEGLPTSELAGILDSYQRKRIYHRLSDGSFLKMDQTDVGDAAQVVDELGLSRASIAKGHATVPAYRALLVDGLLEDEEKDASFEAYLDGIRAVDLGSYTVPSSLEEVLRPYQVEGFRWLCGLADLGLGGILADEMGLGKSVQLIAFLHAHVEDIRASGPALVVCPASLVYNWQAEFEKFAPELVCRVVAGTAGERAQARAKDDTDVLVTSYDLLRRDVEDYQGLPLWCLALDEAQYIKNHATLSAQAVKAVEAQHRVALTGTPVENRLSELWSIFDFLMPGLLGSYDRFRDRYERAIVEEQDEQVAERLRAAVRPFVLRRTKREVIRDLPDKIEEVVRAHMGPQQRRLYDAHVQDLLNQMARGGDESFRRGKLQVLAALMRLRQICCDPRLVYEDYAKGSAKTETILTLVERVIDAGEKMLLFSQFTSFLEVLGSELDSRGVRYLTLTGTTPKRRRVELVDQFNADDTPVFLISLKAGGTGLNLTGASVVIHADPWWNAAAQNQATDRAHRIGQTHDVTVYKVIAARTIEERILELQKTKLQLAEAVVEGDTSSVSLASLTREDLEDLLSS